MLLSELVCSASETALHLPPANLTNNLARHINSAFCIVQGVNGWMTHVVALIRIPRSDPPLYRLYDNDSPARRAGTYSIVPLSYFTTTAQNTYATTDLSSPLAATLTPGGGAGPARAGGGHRGVGPIAVLR